MIRMLSLFSGIGAFEKALENLGIDFEIVNYCEVDKYASQAYSLIHDIPESKNLGDITKINEKELPKDIDLITYGFPCQDISIAGAKKGFEDSEGNKTRSGLFFDAYRIINEVKPKITIAENVKHLTSKSMEKTFKIVLDNLEQAGYNNYWKVLNAKDYGVPQSRDRVFIISIRKDIERNFEFPSAIPLTKVMKDYLEENVPDKYYLSQEKIKKVVQHEENHIGTICDKDGICFTLLTRDYKDPKVIQCADLHYYNYDVMNRVYSSKGISPTLQTAMGGGRQVKIYDHQCYRFLTPREYFRLMGFDDKDVDILVQNKMSKTQLYKMAGNSIVVNVLEAIFKELYDN